MASSINVFSLHYFLWFSALTSIYGYISVYAEHYANATPSQYGFLNMVLPFVTIVAKLFFCSLADRHRAYRKLFISFLITALIGFGSFGILPIFIDPQPKELGLNTGTWILICSMTSLSTISMGVISCLSDAFAMNSSKKSGSSYGQIRVWGAIGWGTSSLLIAFINQTDKLPFLVPGIILTIVLLVIDIAAASFWPYKDDFVLNSSARDTNDNVPQATAVSSVDQSSDGLKSKRVTSYGTADSTSNSINDIPRESETGLKTTDLKIQWMLFKEVAKERKSLFRYLILFTISGSLITMQWSYFFPYLKKVYPDDFSLISGLSMVVQSMVGELPFFILSRLFIQVLGRSHTLSLSFMAIGLRYLLYQIMVPKGMYTIILTEALQGPSFGLFYVVMTEVGLDYSDCEKAIANVIDKGVVPNDPNQIDKLRQALRATMQSLMSACYEGLGLGIGSMIGGLVIDMSDFSSLWIWTSIIAFAVGLANILVELVCHFCRDKNYPTSRVESC